MTGRDGPGCVAAGAVLAGVQAGTQRSQSRSALPVGDPESSVTVGELVLSLRNAMRGLFASGVWVTGEIDGIARSRSGHVFFDLVERRAGGGSEGPVALMPVALFDEHRSHVNNILRAHGLTAPIHDGMRVRIHGRVDMHAARGRVQLKMDGIDPAYASEPVISERRRSAAPPARRGPAPAQR